MRIFISFPSELESIAESIAQSLRNRDYDVFFSHDDLPPGDSFDARVQTAIESSDFMVFLISPESVTKGRYTLTEMAFARTKWPNPSKRVLPVMAAPTPLEKVPNYLRAVTILEPEGNTAAEVRAAVDRILTMPAADGQSFDRSLIRPLVAMTLVSAFFCYLAFVHAGELMTFSFLHSGGVTILPGIIFGLVVATCNSIFGVHDRFQLALVVVMTTMAWVAAYDTSATTFTILDQYSRTVTSTDSSSPSDDKPAEEPAASNTPAMQATERLSNNPVIGYIVGPIGGAVGGAITILALLLTNPKFRRLESVMVCWITAVVAGATFGVAGSKVGSYFWIVIFGVWQTGVILTMARGFPPGTAQIPPWLGKITGSTSSASRDAG